MSQTKVDKLGDQIMALSQNNEHILFNSDRALSTFQMQMWVTKKPKLFSGHALVVRVNEL